MSQTLPELTDATLTLENRVATLTLNRHDVRNALTGTALVDDIIATVDRPAVIFPDVPCNLRRERCITGYGVVATVERTGVHDVDVASRP